MDQNDFETRPETAHTLHISYICQKKATPSLELVSKMALKKWNRNFCLEHSIRKNRTTLSEIPLLSENSDLKQDDDNSSENVGKKRNWRSFKLSRVYLDPLNMSNAGDFSC